MSIKKGDTVLVIAGDSKGKTGTVLQVLKKDNRVVVEGINIVSRHTRPSNSHPDGGIIKKEAPIHISNVKYVEKKAAAPVKAAKAADEKKAPKAEKAVKADDKKAPKKSASVQDK